MNKLRLAILPLIIVSLFLAGCLQSQTLKDISQTANSTIQQATNTTSNLAQAVQPSGNSRMNFKLPAVDRQGNGLLIELTVEKTAGDGGVFFRIDDQSPLVNPDTQKSLKTAVAVARALSNVNYDNINLYYNFNAPSTIVGGQSAGAATAITTLALLRGEKLRADVLITGTVEPDGRIGPVGGVLGKAQAAKRAGFKTLLVPEGESFFIGQREECETSELPGGYVQTCHELPVNVSIANETGMNVTEVFNVQDAYSLLKQ